MPAQVGFQTDGQGIGENEEAISEVVSPTPTPRDGAGGVSDTPGLEFAWRVHAVQEQWASRADTKAAVVFAVQGTIIAGVVAAFANDNLAALISG